MPGPGPSRARDQPPRDLIVDVMLTGDDVRICRKGVVCGSTRAESAITRIGSGMRTMGQIKKTMPDGLPKGV
jgi:hypothetical protein